MGFVALRHVGSSWTRAQTRIPCIGRRILFFFFFKGISLYLFISWLCWVFVSVRGPSPVAASGGHSSSRCAGLSLSWPLLLRSTGSRRAGSVVVAHGPSCSAACAIFPDQGSNPCPLPWQADPQPLHHQGSPAGGFLTTAPPGKPGRRILNHCATREVPPQLFIHHPLMGVGVIATFWVLWILPCECLPPASPLLLRCVPCVPLEGP